MVADPERGVGLDVVTGQLAQPGPAVEEGRGRRNQHAHRVAAFVLGSGQGGGQPVDELGRLGRQEGGRAGRR